MSEIQNFMKGGDAEMRFYCILFSLLLSLTVFIGCGEESANDDDDDNGKPDVVAGNGDIQGTIINKETGDPIKDASVTISGETALTDADGKYVVQGISLAENIDVIVTASGYVEYKGIITLDRELVIFNINLVPVDSQSARILGVLEAFSRDIEALDAGRIPALQLYLTEDYIASPDEVTMFLGVASGVVPADYDAFPDTIRNIIEKYDKIEFVFANPDVELDGDSATVLVRLSIYAETKPVPEPATPAKKWEIVIDGRLDLRKENGDWKITFWQLIPPVLTLNEEPL